MKPDMNLRTNEAKSTTRGVLRVDIMLYNADTIANIANISALSV